MRVAHLIMAHRNPAQIARLAEKLNHPNFDIYLHIDDKVDIEPFLHLKTIPNLYFIKHRSKCNWGGFSLFKGIVDCMVEILHAPTKYAFINMISGQDYPLYDSNHIYEYLKSRQDTIFLSFEESSESEWWRQASLRYEKYHFTDLTMKGRYFIEKVLNKFAPTRKFPETLELYGGNKSCWWTLTRESAQYVVAKLDESPKLLSFLKYCWGTDEFVIPTLIMNSHLKPKVVNDNLRYIDWSEGNAHPKLLGVNDFKEMCNSKMLFARKFDPDFDSEIFDKIDSRSLEEAIK